MKDSNGRIKGEINVVNHILCSYNERDSIKVGILEDGNYMLHIGNEEPPQFIRTIVLSEEALIGLMASIFAYFKQYDVDFPKKIKQYFEGENMEYTFTSNSKKSEEKY